MFFLIKRPYSCHSDIYLKTTKLFNCKLKYLQNLIILHKIINLTMSKIETKWPWQYSFPPFFTLQPHSETRNKQLEAWKNLIVDYFRNEKLCELDINGANSLPVFNNQEINRSLEIDFILLLLEHLEKSELAMPCDKTRKRWLIFWFPLSELAEKIYKWVLNAGLLNTVCTLYELGNGEDTANEDFHSIQKEVLIKALEHLQSKNKCELILFDDNEGVKFF